MPVPFIKCNSYVAGYQDQVMPLKNRNTQTEIDDAKKYVVSRNVSVNLRYILLTKAICGYLQCCRNVVVMVIVIFLGK